MHQPVLLTEAIAALKVIPDQWYLDATFGQGGHTQAILSQGGKVLALDFDEQAIEFGRQSLATAIREQHLILIRENFDQLTKVVTELQAQNKITDINGVLFDFGTNSDQLTDQDRGFSFTSDTELDMRMDNRLGVKAKDLLAIAPEKQLAQLFWEWGGESAAKQIARKIVQQRHQGQLITTTQELVALISQVKPQRLGHLHPATKVFQALRIAVNDELNNIQRALPQALEILVAGGVIVTISFHQGEDKIAKQLFKDWEHQQLGSNLTKKPIIPSSAELAVNQRARSAKLRIFNKDNHDS